MSEHEEGRRTEVEPLEPAQRITPDGVSVLGLGMGGSDAARVLALQRAAGNRAVSRLLATRSHGAPARLLRQARGGAGVATPDRVLAWEGDLFVAFKQLPDVEQVRRMLMRNQPLLTAYLEIADVKADASKGTEAFVHPTLGEVAVIRRGRFGLPHFPGDMSRGGVVIGNQELLWGVDVTFPHGRDPAHVKQDDDEHLPTVTQVDPLTALYLRHFPDPGGGGRDRIDTLDKIQLALDLADVTFLGEVAEAFKASIRDPAFVITTVLTIGIYVGLWLTPDPSMITKIAAGILTAVMLIMFSWNDLWGFCVAWNELSDSCKGATTEDELRVAGDAFLAKLGQVGFDVFLMLLFWGAEKGIGPKVRAGVEARASARANAAVASAEAAPGTGVDVKATADRAALIPKVRAGVGAKATPTEFIEALRSELDSSGSSKARQGLDAFRDTHRAAAANKAAKSSATGNPDELGDAAVKTVIDARQNAGTDIVRWIEEQAMSKQERAAAREAVGQAKADAALKRIMQLRDDPALAEPIKRAGWIQNIVTLARILLDPASLRAAVKARNVPDLVSILGEMLSRAELRGRVKGLSGVEIRPSLEVARRVPFKTRAEWLEAQRQAWEAGGRHGPEPNMRSAARLRTRGDELWESLGQADNVVAERQGGGKLKINMLEETKTGNETQQSAMTQLTDFRSELGKIADGSSPARLFERSSATELGSDVTGDFDLDTARDAQLQTTGLAGRTGYGTQLGDDRPALEGAAQV
jgi:hypothetical protein